MRTITSDRLAPSDLIAEILDVNCVQDVDDVGRVNSTIGFYENSADAKRAADGTGWYGGDARITPRKTIRLANGESFVLDASFAEPVTLNTNLISEAKRVLEEAQRAALTNLTEDQRKLLGLKF